MTRGLLLYDIIVTILKFKKNVYQLIYGMIPPTKTHYSIDLAFDTITNWYASSKKENNNKVPKYFERKNIIVITLLLYLLVHGELMTFSSCHRVWKMISLSEMVHLIKTSCFSLVDLVPLFIYIPQVDIIY